MPASVSATTMPRASVLARSRRTGAFIDQPGDAAGHARCRDERSVRQLCDAQFTVGLRELSEDVDKLSEGQARLSLQVRVESAHERGVGPQQRTPRPVQTAPVWHLVRHEPVEELRDVGLVRYLHLHLYPLG